ncbi:MAG TPA: hypothetical protein DEQ47_05980, partial [Solibacterales bacterium]|nr:hypothetical protein [Bryobacterales bacterium]
MSKLGKTARVSTIAILGPFGLLGIAYGQATKVDFVKDIQPIFQKSCLMCHGPHQQMGNLRLDAKQSVFAKVVVPGKSAESPLYQRVAGTGDVARMPMGGVLAKAQIDTIKAWIDQGGEWPDGIGAQVTATKTHWAFVPPKRPALPAVKNTAWPRNAIDDFILARLEKENLSPSPEADRITLLRRVSLDLTGLPPTPEEVDAFLKDKRKNAYERQVDRLLNSPHYGERWGRQWLDAAQYADSNGYEKDRPREVWFYRDWVINSLNRNLPYNQFVIDQIAGDMLPNATQDQIVATGFLRNTLINEEGGVDPEQFRMEAMFDRMHAVGTAILGLTIQCAQCHNHKFDPLKQEEYYRMMSFLNQTHEADVSVYTPQEEMQRTEILRRTREMEGTLQRRTPNWRERMTQWEEQVQSNQPEWSVLRPTVDDISTGGERYLPLKDGSFLALGYAPTQHRVKMTVKTDARNISAFRLELLTDPELPRGGPGRSSKGTCALTEFEVEAAPVDAPTKITKVKFSSATADFNPPETVAEPEKPEPAKRETTQPEAGKPDKKPRKPLVSGPVSLAIDGKDETAWSLDAGPGLRNQSRKAVFTAATPIDNPGGALLTFYLAQKHASQNSDKEDNNNIGRLRLSLTTAPNAAADPLPAGVREILSIPREQRTPRQVETVFG